MISLFNGFIPIVAVQIQCVELNGVVTLVASKVLDVLPLGTDEEEDAGGAADRDYWLKLKGPAALTVMDSVFELIQLADPALTLKYNKAYIGLARHGVADNMITFRLRKQHILVNFRLDRTDELDTRLEESGVDVLRWNTKTGRLSIRLAPDDVAKQRPVLQELVNAAVGNP